ncbi:hypothetical protein COCSUDRAFT_57598 [Coccomyxa subellipsoidea C-169]|uniref:Uncharacterized protein n=1 Tax=Coccomyxa subellipsoidea (strain C-169) TaxID=574566 RepID=I0YPX9_COCSC|nr:hypothetical protein COCSUDRAFT_57598 [Coccomyxa subellipsoidea C-169]EIE20448.1 hypothetical protein COCSUDRAFT_57598 [Coccomyxa subellipsoidea C-169]|eukprot:XP_005644992.1 hypothetical protein COCSUDRAFT_57598 [Coccomyxa subellipsoidea C-169]
MKAELEVFVHANLKDIGSEVHNGLLVAAAEFKGHIALERVPFVASPVPSLLTCGASAEEGAAEAAERCPREAITEPKDKSLAVIEAALGDAEHAWESCIKERGCSEGDGRDQSPCASVHSIDIEPWEISEGSLCMESPRLAGRRTEELL